MYFGLGFMFVVGKSYFGISMMSQLWCFYVKLDGVWIVVGVGTNIVVHDNVHDFSYLIICFMIHP